MDILAPFKKLIYVVFAAEYDNGNSGAAATIDFANGQKQKITLTANTTLTIAAPPGVGHYQLRLIEDATGGRTLAFTGLAANLWIASATQPDHNTAANGISVWNGFYDGAAWSMCSLAKVGAA